MARILNVLYIFSLISWIPFYKELIAFVKKYFSVKKKKKYFSVYTLWVLTVILIYLIITT